MFTASRMEYADAIIDLIDTKDIITYRLYRDVLKLFLTSY